MKTRGLYCEDADSNSAVSHFAHELRIDLTTSTCVQRDGEVTDDPISVGPMYMAQVVLERAEQRGVTKQSNLRRFPQTQFGGIANSAFSANPARWASLIGVQVRFRHLLIFSPYALTLSAHDLAHGPEYHTTACGKNSETRE